MKQGKGAVNSIRYFVGIVLLLALIAGATAAQADGQIATWAKKYPGERYYFFTDQTSDDGFIVVSDIVLSYKQYDWIYRLDRNGDMVWQKLLDNGAGAYVARQTPDSGFITASGLGTMKLDSQGNIEWQKSYGIDAPLNASQAGIQALRTTADGGYIAAGGVALPGNSFDVFAAKLAANGDVEWFKSFGGTGSEYLGDIEQTSDGGFLLSAYTASFGAGGTDVWLVKLNSSGDIEWQKIYGMPWRTEYWRLRYGHRVVEAADGGFAFITSSISRESVSNVWVVKTDRAGDILWQKLYGSMGDSASIERTPDNGYIIGGAAPSATNNDMLIMKLDGDGNILWQKNYGKPGYEWFYQVRPTRDGGYYMTGWDWSFSGTYWIMKLDETGSIFGCAADLMSDGAATATDADGTAQVSSAVAQTFAITVSPVTGGTTRDMYLSAGAVCEETAPNISVAPAALAFGPVEISRSAALTLTVSNSVNKPLTISSVSLGGADAGLFLQTNTCSTIEGIGSCTVTVTFTPVGVGARSAEVTIISNDPDTPTIVVPVTGTGIDVLPPVSTAAVNGKKESGDWYVSEVNVALAATDSGSGVREIHYTIDGTEVVVAGNTAAFTLSADGSHSVTYFSVDNAGNSEAVHPLTINIDRTAPAVTLAADPNALWPPNHKMVPVRISGSAADTGSGIASVVITVADEYGVYNMTVPGFNSTILLEASRRGADMDGRVYTITAVVTDTSGNSSTSTTTVVVAHDRGDRVGED